MARSATFKIIKACMGYVAGEEPTILDLEHERETELLGDGSIKFVSGDEPRTKKTPIQKGGN